MVEFAAILGDRSAGAREHASLIAIEHQKKVYSDSVGLRDKDEELPKRLEGARRGTCTFDPKAQADDRVKWEFNGGSENLDWQRLYRANSLHTMFLIPTWGGWR